MLTINSLKNGIVIDHIKEGLGIKIFNYLGLQRADFTVALILNVESSKLTKKDMIKIENFPEIDFKVLGLIDPHITINIIENEEIKDKINFSLPVKVEDLIKCKNPRCVTSNERYVKQTFHLVDEANLEYRCEYCDEIYKVSEVQLDGNYN